ncbi:MAG: hypothetical protein AAF928_18720 [Myxococcota bacterium]
MTLVTLALTVAAVGLVMAAMALGVIVSGRRLQGSCGGRGADCQCDARARGACPGPSSSAPERLISTDLHRRRGRRVKGQPYQP